MPINSERVEFAGADGDMLAGRIDAPRGHVRAWAIFAHCFSCSKDFIASRRISRELADRGIGVLRFDFTGLGNSDGDFANTNFSSNVADLVAAANWLAETHGPPQLLVGHSLGGAAVIAAAKLVASARAVVTVGAPADVEHVEKLFADKLDDIETHGVATVSIEGRTFRIKRQFLDDIGVHNIEDAVAELRRPLLVFHAPLDAVVGIENATRLFVAARHPKSFVSLDDADHLLTNEDAAAHVGSVISAWAARYLVGASETDAPPDAVEGAVVVREAGSRYANDIVAGEHAVRADEPERLGGGDTGPTPYDFLLAALGSCTSITIRMYANRKKWPLSRVSVVLRHAREHVDDCENCEDHDDSSMTDVMTREIRLEGDLDEKQRQRLMEIADKCPVHRTLATRTVFRTTLVDQASS